MRGGVARKFVDPQSAAVKRPVRGWIGVIGAGNEMPGGQFPGGERVINAFPGEWLDDPGGVADQKELALERSHRGSRQRTDRAPRVICRDREMGVRPAFQGLNVRRAAHETEVELVVAHGRRPAITVWQKSQRYSRPEPGRSRDVGLQPDAISGGFWESAQQAGHGGVATVGRHEFRGLENLFSGVHRPEIA